MTQLCAGGLECDAIRERNLFTIAWERKGNDDGRNGGEVEQGRGDFALCSLKLWREESPVGRLMLDRAAGYGARGMGSLGHAIQSDSRTEMALSRLEVFRARCLNCRCSGVHAQ